MIWAKNRMTRLTKTIVEAAVPLAGKPLILWDQQLSGFGVKILPTGARKYLIKYRTMGGGRRATQRWFMLGTHGAISCEQARTMAQKALGEIASGIDPQAQRFKMRNDSSLKEIWDRFESEELPSKKQGTQDGYKLIWRNNVEPFLGRQKANAVLRSDIDRLHKKLRSTPYHSNRVLSLLSRLFNLAEAWGVIKQGTNPTKFVERFKEIGRERFLSFGEIEKLGQALSHLDLSLPFEAKAAVLLLLLTGARRNEILKAEWSWIDTDNSVMRLPDSKTGKKLIYLSDAALTVVDELRAKRKEGSKWLLPSTKLDAPLYDVKGPWRKICEAAGLDGVRLHDLRHTAASIAVNQGSSLAVIGRVLGHRQSQTTMRYSHVDADPALAVVNAIGESVNRAMAVKG
jgi:integrase